MRHADSLRPPRQTAPEELSHARVRAPHVVVNTCPVVPPDDVAKLLRPFRRRGVGRIRDVGLGLGLSIVAAIAEAHGGSLRGGAMPGRPPGLFPGLPSETATRVYPSRGPRAPRAP